MKRICVDMDEVMADALGEHLLRYNQHFGEEITLEDLHGKWLWEVVSADRHAVLEAYLRSEDFFDVLAVMPESQRVLRRLQMNYEVFRRSTVGSRSTFHLFPRRTSFIAAIRASCGLTI